MEVFFLDVAQGTCQVILLGDHRAIVLDCGIPNDRLVVQFLQKMGIDRLDCLIVSHSHNDHIGGAVSVLGAYQNRIERICFVQDHLFLESAFWKRLCELLKADVLSKDQLIRLESTDEPQFVWTDALKSARLRTFSPMAAENLLAQDAGHPNPTSAVLFLDVVDNRVIFAADSEFDQWKEIRSKSGKKMSCDVLAVPHHAGKAHQNACELKWLFDEALSADVAVVSVGTSNIHGHPRRDVIEAMTKRGTKVMCTQITRRCNGDSPNLEALRPSVLRPLSYSGRSSTKGDFTDAGHSRNVACAGTVRVCLSAAGVDVDRLKDHQQSVDRLSTSSNGCPLCRQPLTT